MFNGLTWILTWDKSPAERKASVVNGRVWPEDNEERWARRRNRRRGSIAELAKWRGAGAGTVIQRHAVVKATRMSFYRQLVERCSNHLQYNTALLFTKEKYSQQSS